MGIVASSRVRRYALYFLAWTLVGVFFFSESLTQSLITRDPTRWWGLLASRVVGIYVLAALSPIIFWLGRRFPIERKFWLRRVGLHLLFSGVFAFIDLAIGAEAYVVMRVIPILPRSFSGTYALLLLIGYHGVVVAYWALLVGQHSLRYYRQYQERAQQALRLELQASELQRQLARAQLGALKAQLHPHFLFNTLNAIMVLVRQEKGRQAEETLALLSDLLRCVLDDVEAQEVPLRRELEYLRLYLAIEQVRFQDRLRIETSVDPEVLDAAVPHMALQPIVENAIRHGIGKSSAAGKIEIRAIRSNDLLEIRVQDDGPGLQPPSSSPTQGIGLANTRNRLQQLYGESSHLAVKNGEAGGVVATMVIPYHLALDSTQTELIEVHASNHLAG
jgi:two-component system, LytTR family, sensor kinase